jgi:hypothetical protein
MGKKKVVKGDAVRAYFRQNPEAMPSEVIKIMAKRGIQVSEGLVGNIKTEIRKELRAIAEAQMTEPTTSPVSTSQPTETTSPQPAAPQPAAQEPLAVESSAPAMVVPAAERGGELLASDLFEAKRLADELGGIERARQALDLLEKLR